MVDQPTSSEGSRNLPVFRVAQTLADVQGAWSLVHDAYCRIGLIDRNQFGVHCVLQAINPQTAVIVGKIDGQAVSTLSIIPESSQRIPLQSVYPQELETLRNDGRKLLEVGLLADRREHLSRAMVSIFEMMRYVFWYAYRSKTDIIIGVHPHHAGFYINSFGFEYIGSESTHPAVKDHPVVPMRLDLQTVLARDVVPKRLTAYLNNPLPEDTFDARFDFNHEAMENSPLGMYSQAKIAKLAAMKNTG